MREGGFRVCGVGFIWKSAERVSSSMAQVLALELLKVLLENSGEVFQGSEKFTGAIKQYLCLSLLKNAASTISAAQTLTCSIFYTLLVKFRHALKAEVGVFFPMILLKAIEPPAPSTAGAAQPCQPPLPPIPSPKVILHCLPSLACSKAAENT